MRKGAVEVIEAATLCRAHAPGNTLFATVSMGWESGTSRGDDEPSSNPTVVNNVETLAAAAHVLAQGPTWYRTFGTPESPGTIVATVVGDVQRPGVHEVALGTPFAELLERCGGPRRGRTSRRRSRYLESGVTAPTSMWRSRTRLPSAGDRARPCARRLRRQDRHGECRPRVQPLSVGRVGGQCPRASRDRWRQRTPGGIEQGRGHDDDLASLAALLRTVTDATGATSVRGAAVVSSLLRAFPDDFAPTSSAGEATATRLVPLIVDIDDDGTVVYATKQARKRPDWTYPD